MDLIHPHSLSETVNAVNHAFAHGQEPSAGARVATARWIAGRHDLPGAYAGTFAFLPEEHRDGVRLYTGERTKSAVARHVMGEEACRARRRGSSGRPSARHAATCTVGGGGRWRGMWLGARAEAPRIRAR